MKNVISFDGICTLMKLYNKDKRINIKFGYFWMISILLSNSILSNLSSVNQANQLNLNFWDGVFRILSYPYFILYIYIPGALILLNPSKKLYEKYVTIRFNRKIKLIINEIAFKFIYINIFSLIYIISICILSCLYFKIQLTWSSDIINMENTAKYSQSIYPNNFINIFSPQIALIINIIQINLTIIFVDMIRGFIIDLKGSFKRANILISLLLIVNFILFNFSILGKIQDILNYFLISNFVLLWNHKFDLISFSNVTIQQSVVVLLLLTIAFIILRIVFCKEMRVIDGDYIN